MIFIPWVSKCCGVEPGLRINANRFCVCSKCRQQCEIEPKQLPEPKIFYVNYNYGSTKEEMEKLTNLIDNIYLSLAN